MSEPFLAEIRMVGFDFAPRGWAFTDGQILPISQNQSLYSLLGTTYGGDGSTTFALPDLRGRTPIHNGGTHTLGQKSGEEGVTLTAGDMPAHSHTVKASSVPGTQRAPGGHLFASETAPEAAYREAEAATMTELRTGTVANVGGGQQHSNMQPFLAVNFCIALQGLFPSRN